MRWPDPIDWALMAVVFIIIWLLSGATITPEDQVPAPDPHAGHRHITMDGMPCIEARYRLTCDWSKYDE